MLFGRKKKLTPSPSVKKNRGEKQYELPYSRNFRGFKRFLLTVHGDSESEKNNEILYNSDFSDSIFIFKCFNNEYGNRIACLYIDDYKMGTVYDSDQIYAIEHGLIEKIHIEPKEEVVLGKKRTETRHRISVLVKYVKLDED